MLIVSYLVLCVMLFSVPGLTVFLLGLERSEVVQVQS